MWEQPGQDGAAVCSGFCSNLHDLDWTHAGAPLRLSSQERWLFLHQLDLQLFICKVTHSEVLQLLHSEERGGLPSSSSILGRIPVSSSNSGNSSLGSTLAAII